LLSRPNLQFCKSLTQILQKSYPARRIGAQMKENLNRREFLRSASVGVSTLAMCGRAFGGRRRGGRRKKPNVLFIAVDDLRPPDEGAAGGGKSRMSCSLRWMICVRSLAAMAISG